MLKAYYARLINVRDGEERCRKVWARSVAQAYKRIDHNLQMRPHLIFSHWSQEVW